jgi:DNA-binding transcriptional ArsR family regulator
MVAGRNRWRTSVAMSPSRLATLRRQTEATAPLFAALGDSTRLSLVLALSGDTRQSIAQLAEKHVLTRQAISKHLRVLEHAGLVSSQRKGRESLFVLNPGALDAMRSYIDRISEQWDASLARLAAFVES